MNILIVVLLLSGVSHLYAGDLKHEVMGRINYLREHNDRSHFFMSAASEDQPANDRYTKVHFIVTDSQGQKTGFESLFTFPEGDLGVNSLREIPNTAYGVSQAYSLDPSIVPHEPEAATLNMFPPVLKGTYTIQFIGLNNCKFHSGMYLDDINGGSGKTELFEAYIASGTTRKYIVYLDPTPGALAPVIKKVVTFYVLRDDVIVAQKLAQLGDDKFADSLVKNLDLAEKLSAVCGKRESEKEKCEPASVVLKLFIRRLELANRKCGNPADCDEEREWAAFRKEHGKDDAFKDFFRDWDAGDWQKHKKNCKRFISDEALKILREDANWMIKSLGGGV